MSKFAKYWLSIFFLVALMIGCMIGSATFVHETGDTLGGLTLMVISSFCSVILASSMFSRGRGY